MSVPDIVRNERRATALAPLKEVTRRHDVHRCGGDVNGDESTCRLPQPHHCVAKSGPRKQHARREATRIAFTELLYPRYTPSIDHEELMIVRHKQKSVSTDRTPQCGGAL